jgi:type IV secretory pathway VirB10-like protein
MRKNEAPVKEEGQLSFEQLKPKIYYKNQEHNVKNSATTIKLPENNAIRNNHPISSEHNVSLLKEYFEQQALIKIKEEDDARISPIAFGMEIKESSKVTGNNLVGSQQLATNEANKLLKAGSIIPCVLSTTINSDLPGMVVARVREHVFDTATGKFLLIQQGAILIGYYNNNVNFGQERVQIEFERIDMPPSIAHPNGYSVTLNNLAGYDLAGSAGMKDQVNHHYGQVAMGVSLSSLLAAASKEPRENLTYNYRAMNKASDNISEIANKIADKQLNQSPTIVIKGGVPFNIIVAKDLLLSPIVGVSNV